MGRLHENGSSIAARPLGAAMAQAMLTEQAPQNQRFIRQIPPV